MVALKRSNKVHESLLNESWAAVFMRGVVVFGQVAGRKAGTDSSSQAPLACRFPFLCLLTGFVLRLFLCLNDIPGKRQQGNIKSSVTPTPTRTPTPTPTPHTRTRTHQTKRHQKTKRLACLQDTPEPIKACLLFALMDRHACMSHSQQSATKWREQSKSKSTLVCGG